MQRDDIIDMVREELAKVVNNPHLMITELTNAENVQGWDSFNHLKLLFSIETRLNLHFDVADIADPTDIGDLVDLIQRKLAV